MKPLAITLVVAATALAGHARADEILLRDGTLLRAHVVAEKSWRYTVQFEGASPTWNAEIDKTTVASISPTARIAEGALVTVKIEDGARRYYGTIWAADRFGVFVEDASTRELVGISWTAISALERGRHKPCLRCDGGGTLESERDCPSCAGYGYEITVCSKKDGNDGHRCEVCRGYGHFNDGSTCRTCGGVGAFYVSNRTCKACSGSGRWTRACPRCSGSGDLR